MEMRLLRRSGNASPIDQAQDLVHKARHRHWVTTLVLGLLEQGTPRSAALPDWKPLLEAARRANNPWLRAIVHWQLGILRLYEWQAEGALRHSAMAVHQARLMQAEEERIVAPRPVRKAGPKKQHAVSNEWLDKSGSDWT